MVGRRGSVDGGMGVGEFKSFLQLNKRLKENLKKKKIPTTDLRQSFLLWGEETRTLKMYYLRGLEI